MIGSLWVPVLALEPLYSTLVDERSGDCSYKLNVTVPNVVIDRGRDILVKKRSKVTKISFPQLRLRFVF